MPEESYLYALPYNLYKEHGHPSLRRARHQPLLCNPGSGKNANKPVEELTSSPATWATVVPFLLSATVNALTTPPGLTPLEGLAHGYPFW